MLIYRSFQFLIVGIQPRNQQCQLVVLPTGLLLQPSLRIYHLCCSCTQWLVKEGLSHVDPLRNFHVQIMQNKTIRRGFIKNLPLGGYIKDRRTKRACSKHVFNISGTNKVCEAGYLLLKGRRDQKYIWGVKVWSYTGCVSSIYERSEREEKLQVKWTTQTS